MLPHNEDNELKDRKARRLARNKRIDRKSKLLARLDPKHAVNLEGTFTNRVADAISAFAQPERQHEVDKATEAYENALDGVLYELLDKPFAGEWVAVSDHHHKMLEEGEQQAAVGAFLLAHEGHPRDVEVQRGAWTVYCRCTRCEDVRTYEVDNEAREEALGLPPWPEEDEKKLV